MMKTIINLMKKTVKVEGYEELTVTMFIFYTCLSLMLFPIYAVAYGISHLLKLRGREDMETFSEWFEPLISLIKGEAVIR